MAAPIQSKTCADGAKEHHDGHEDARKHGAPDGALAHIPRQAPEFPIVGILPDEGLGGHGTHNALVERTCDA